MSDPHGTFDRLSKNPLIVGLVIVFVGLFMTRGTNWYDGQSSNNSKLDRVIEQGSRNESAIAGLTSAMAKEHEDNEKKFLMRDDFVTDVSKRDKRYDEAANWREEKDRQFDEMAAAINAILKKSH